MLKFNKLLYFFQNQYYLRISKRATINKIMSAVFCRGRDFATFSPKPFSKCRIKKCLGAPFDEFAWGLMLKKSIERCQTVCL